MRSGCEVGLNLNHHIGLHLFFSNWIVCVCRVRRRHNPEEGQHPCILVYLFFVYLKSSNICISSLSLSIPNSRYIEEICFNMFSPLLSFLNSLKVHFSVWCLAKLVNRSLFYFISLSYGSKVRTKLYLDGYIFSLFMRHDRVL